MTPPRKKVVLLSTYDLGRQPFGLASPAAWLRERGHEVAVADLAVSSLPRKALVDADAVGFHLPMHTATRLTVPLAERVRALNPGARLVAYGLYAPLNAEYLRSLGFAAVLGGEFEAGLVRAIEENGPTDLVSLERLAFRVPDRAGLPKLGRYAHVHTAAGVRTVGYTEASRGCKHLCRHCPIVPVYQGAFRIVPVEVVLADIEQQVASGAEHITFGDPDFLNGPTHALRVIEGLHRQWPTVSYDVTVKVEHILKHRDILPVFKATGCLWVTSAVESTENRVLEKLDKGHSRAGFLAAVEAMRAVDLTFSPTFVAFTPWTTAAGYRDLLAVVWEQKLVEAVAPIQLAMRLLIPSGSRLLELQDLRKHLNGYDPAGLLHRWTHEDEYVDRLASEAFQIVTDGQRQKLDRRALFARLWELANRKPLENFDLMPRATIPYLDEPWYC